MALVSRLSCLLALLVIIILAEEDVHYIQTKGRKFIFYPVGDLRIFSKDTPEGSLLLWNTSNPSPEKATGPDVRSRLRVKWDYPAYLHIYNLINSDSGLYRSECWDFSMNKTQQNNIQLTVCGDHYRSVQDVLFSGSVELQCKGAGAGHNMTVQWYRANKTVNQMTRRVQWVRIFPLEDGSLNHVVKHLEGRVQMVENSSSLHITNFRWDDFFIYNCLVFDRQNCVRRETIYLGLKQQHVYHTEGERAVLPCFENTNINRTSESWYTPHGKKYPESNGSSHVTEQRQQMYVVDDRTREGRDMSLVIPSLTLTHSGDYICYSQNRQRYLLLVCPESEPLVEFFSIGDNVTLHCLSNRSSQDRVLWFRRTTRHRGIILDMGKLPDDLKERVQLYTNYTMVISNLSAQDDGEYWCAVKHSGSMCKSTTRVVLFYLDPFGIYSNFYTAWASLMSCGLLGMICAVVTVDLKTRAWTSGKRKI